jgi:hypothetical protein
MTVMAFRVTQNPNPVSAADRAAILQAPSFGKYFTDHMVRIDWTAAGGWGEGAVVPYGPLSIDPASSVLHYGQEIFEGLKAYRQPGRQQPVLVLRLPAHRLAGRPLLRRRRQACAGLALHRVHPRRPRWHR